MFPFGSHLFFSVFHAFGECSLEFGTFRIQSASIHRFFHSFRFMFTIQLSAFIVFASLDRFPDTHGIRVFSARFFLALDSVALDVFTVFERFFCVEIIVTGWLAIGQIGQFVFQLADRFFRNILC